MTNNFMFHGLFIWNHTQIESKGKKNGNQILCKKKINVI